MCVDNFSSPIQIKTARCVIALLLLFILDSCGSAYNPLDDYEQMQAVTILPVPDAAAGTSYAPEITSRGKYLVGLLGCGSCHTDGALVGLPNQDRLLAGSETGIAYSNPLAVKNPGVVFPANLTPDIDTGIGNWTLDQLVDMIRSGQDNHGRKTLPVMPWPAYSDINPEDLNAIAIYLKSLAPVTHSVPQNVSSGQSTTQPYVHFGVYQSKDLINSR